jgi:nucleoside-diphosphate kinase
MSVERTLVLVKPDGVQRGLVGEVIGRLERRGLQLIGLKLMQMDEALAGQHYAEHTERPFFPGLRDFMTSSPLVAAVFAGENAVQAARQTMGATDPLASEPGSIRGDLGLDIGRNVVHGSDSAASGEREVGLFFREEELLGWQRDEDRWVRE